MQLLWIILRALFPTDPVQQCIGAARHRIALMASQVFSPQGLFLLEHDPQARLHIEALIIDYETALHTAIGARACQIARMRFRFQSRVFYRPTRALSVEQLLARVRALVTMINNIERLAQIRAERLMRERDADPLGLGATSPHRLDASQRATSPNRFARGGGKALVFFLLQPRAGGGGALRSSVTEGAAVGARGPPIFEVQPHPKPASQANLRGRPRMLRPDISRKTPVSPQFTPRHGPIHLRQADTAGCAMRRAHTDGDTRAELHPPHARSADHQRRDLCGGRRACSHSHDIHDDFR